MVTYFSNVWYVFNNSNSGLTTNTIYSIVLDDSNNIWLGTDDGVFKYDGLNWTQYLNNKQILSLTFDPYKNLIWIGSGVYLDPFIAKYDGSDWTFYDDTNSPINSIVNKIVVDNYSNKWICTFDQGLLEFNENGIISEIEACKLNKLKYTLDQNYPNPFNPNTKIRYQLPNAGNVVLKVFNVLGREVATLLDEYRNVGSYEIEFKSTVGSHQMANGVYFYRLQVGDYIETKKMILLK